MSVPPDPARQALAEKLEARARVCREAGLLVMWETLPMPVQNALWGIASELDDAVAALAAAPPSPPDAQRATVKQTGPNEWIVSRGPESFVTHVRPPSPPLIEALEAYIGPEPMTLLERMDAGEPLVGQMANPKWVKLLRALAAARGETREADARLAAMETENAKLEADDERTREEPFEEAKP